MERTAANHGPVGIGGWLLLPILGLIITPLLILVSLRRDVLPALETSAWNALTTPGEPIYHSLWAPYIIGSIVLNAITITSAIWLLVLGFKCRKSFPNLIIAFYLYTVSVAMFEMAAVNGFLATVLPAEARNMEPQVSGALVRAIVVCGIWSIYFKVSKRVKNTFIV